MHCTIRFEHPKSLRMDRVLENGVIEKESSRWFPNWGLGTSGHRWLRGTGGPMNPKPIGGLPFKVSEKQIAVGWNRTAQGFLASRPLKPRSPHRHRSGYCLDDPKARSSLPTAPRHTVSPMASISSGLGARFSQPFLMGRSISAFQSRSIRFLRRNS
uniref:Uncharacterized protein n=1 Tax=Candidatus Kentrum sp. LFY TaxID=2126342 RepID=A0A450WXE6_9GAMM|nr:MAG: hypothetical protein BECKLFY1418C_GA0070996_11003 [Candidatus Kentron sp. LFY]